MWTDLTKVFGRRREPRTGDEPPGAGRARYQLGPVERQRVDHRGNVELAAKLAAALETMSPMLDATKAAWCAADAELGSGADHTAVVRYWEQLAGSELGGSE